MSSPLMITEKNAHKIKHLKYTLLIFLQSRYGKPQFEASHASSK